MVESLLTMQLINCAIFIKKQLPQKTQIQVQFL
jgi:hypothetical protein